MEINKEGRYGMVLAKEKNEPEAMEWLVRSVHIFPMNWGCWQEMTSLISKIEDVSFFFSCLTSYVVVLYIYICVCVCMCVYVCVG